MMMSWSFVALVDRYRLASEQREIAAGGERQRDGAGEGEIKREREVSGEPRY